MSNGKKTTDIPFVKVNEQKTDITEDKDYIPTSGEVAILKALQKKVEKFGLEGVEIGFLTDPDLRQRMPYATRNMGERRIIVADPETTLRAYVHGASVEGVLRHEYGHIERGNWQNKEKLCNVANIAFCIDGIDRVLSGDVKERAEGKVVDAVINQFGSIDNFRGAMNGFETDIGNFLQELQNKVKPEILSASPEALAVLIEENTPDYLLLEETMDTLPSLKSLQGLASKCFDSVKSVMQAMREDGSVEISQAELGSDLKEQLSRIAKKFPETDLLNNNMWKAEEYAVDGDAVRNSHNPKDIGQGIAYLFSDGIEQMISAKDIPVSEADEFARYIMSKDGSSHPAPNNRLERINFITEHGRSPSEAEMAQLMENRAKREIPIIAEGIELASEDKIEKRVTPPINAANKGRSR
jgi:hypothetical protein